MVPFVFGDDPKRFGDGQIGPSLLFEFCTALSDRFCPAPCYFFQFGGGWSTHGEVRRHFAVPTEPFIKGCGRPLLDKMILIFTVFSFSVFTVSDKYEELRLFSSV